MDDETRKCYEEALDKIVEQESLRVRIIHHLEKYRNRWYSRLIRVAERRFNTLYYWVAWRFIPRHQYNKIRLDLPPGYYDGDDRIEAAILTEFIHWYESDQHHEETRKPVEDLYKQAKSKSVCEWYYDFDSEEREELITTIFMNRGRFWY